MRILVAGGFEASSQWANAINTVKMAQAFQRLGHEVTLVCRRPPHGRVSDHELARIHGLGERLRWVQLPHDFLGVRVGSRVRFTGLATAVLLRERPDLVFARSFLLPWASSRLGFQTVAEKHTPVGRTHARFRALVRATHRPSFRLWVTISTRLADYYAERGARRDKLLVLPGAVDLALFRRPPDAGPSPYPGPGPHVAYVGHLYDEKGIPTLLETASLMPAVRFHLVGGWPEDIDRQRRRAAELGLANVAFHGLRPQREVPRYLWHADVLVLPPSQRAPSAAWTSPVKLGEYLASGTPVVASAIPALQDWLTGEEVEFVTPDEPGALARGIRRVLDDRPRADALVAAATMRAAGLSYESRAAAILRACGLEERAPDPDRRLQPPTRDTVPH